MADNGGVSPAWGAKGILGPAAAPPNMVAQERERPASSDGAMVANPEGEALGVLDRRTMKRNYPSSRPVAVREKS